MPQESLWSLVSRTVSGSGSIEQAVFYLLAAFSLASWLIILMKLIALQSARKNSATFQTLFGSADNFGTVLAGEHTVGPSPQLSIFKAAVHAMETRGAPHAGHASTDARKISLKPENAPGEMVLLAMQHTSKAEFMRLQSGLGFLATIGSTSPFIGLFGTVWGIMDTFRELGNAKSASLAVVAPGISSALIATAAGLAVAIPAVMAYNWFLGQFDTLEESATCFIERMQVLIHASGWQSAPQHAPGINPANQQNVMPTSHIPASYVQPNARPPINPHAPPIVGEARPQA
jgi:biopolymer transport protein TolQ